MQVDLFCLGCVYHIYYSVYSGMTYMTTEWHGDIFQRKAGNPYQPNYTFIKCTFETQTRLN